MINNNYERYRMFITKEEENPKTRRYCHYCKSKKYIQNMVKVYYPLIKESYWFCSDCFESRESNVIIKNGILPSIKEF